MNGITDYIVVWDDYLSRFEALVEQRIRAGYVPQGGVAVTVVGTGIGTVTRFSQALILRGDAEPQPATVPFTRSIEPRGVEPTAGMAIPSFAVG
jgi:hypothetical protein